MKVSAASLEALEFASLKRVAADLAACDLGRELLLEATPFDHPDELSRSLGTTREVERLIEDGPLVQGFEDEVAPLLTTVAREHAEVTGRSLLQLAVVLKTGQRALQRIRESDEAELLGAASAGIADPGPLANEIRRALDERGRVRDDASPRLAQLSKKNRKVRGGLYSRLGEYVVEQRDNLAEETVSVQDGRLVLMLRSGSKGRLPGLVQGRSSTGKSFYFEPLEFVEANNELKESLREEEAERQRIFSELLSRVRAQIADIRAVGRLLADLDARQALVRLKQTVDGHFIEPRDGDPVELIEARHPLLDPLLAEVRQRALGQAGHTEAVVPLSMELGSDERILIVTGPNAGGKTVALKTVGLLALAGHCGFPIPAGLHSRMPFVSEIVAVVGDEQDLLEERSTFSGRLLRLHEAWEAAGPQSLILLDELGSGTDPSEGAALGIALLEALSRRRPWTVITTHLTAIAAAALESDQAACAAMEFDADSGRPTFRLARGAPGASEALALARRLELSDAWLTRAEELLAPEERRLRKLLQEVEASKKALESDRESLRAELARAKRDRAEASDLLAEASREKALAVKSLKRELRDFRDRVRSKLRGEVERIEGELRSGRKKTAVSRSVDRIFEEAPALESSAPVEAELVVGAAVEHSGLGWKGELTKLDGKKATVLVRGKRVGCDASELIPASDSPPVRPAPAAAGRGRGPSAAVAAEATKELMLVGQRVELALDELDRFLDRALLESSEWVRIVHGHGTGRLRAAVREHLRSHPAVESWRRGESNEGGNGATVAALRG